MCGQPAPAAGPLAGCRLCASAAAVGRGSTGTMSAACVPAGGRCPAVVARTLGLGSLDLLALGLWLPPQFFLQVASHATQQGQFDTKQRDLPFLFA